MLLEAGTIGVTFETFVSEASVPITSTSGERRFGVRVVVVVVVVAAA